MIYIELLVLLILTLVNGLLAMSELSVVSSRKARIKHLAHLGDRNIRAVLRLKEDPSRFLSTVQIGITLVGIFAGAFSGATVANRLGDWLDSFSAISPHGDTLGIVITVAGITYLSLILGELVPKRIALAHPERVAAFVARPMLGLSRVAAPVVWILKISSELLMRLLGLSTVRQSTVSEEEVKTLIAEGTLTGIFVPQEREMIEGVLRLADRPVRLIMTPRTDIAWIDASADRQEIFDTLAVKRFSRLLVCDGQVDRPIGVIHTKDILPIALRCEEVNLKNLMTPALFVPEGITVLKLIELFKHEKLRVAIVVDEHGTTEGLITLTDVLESIAGDLPEHGEEIEPPIIRREDGSWLVDGALAIDEFEAHTGLTGLCKEEGLYTMAGFFMHHMERMPVAGMRFRHRNASFEVVDMDGRRIDKILIQLDPAHPKATES
ncbi:MAG: hemolysin family protein [Desulfatitalea sp.]